MDRKRYIVGVDVGQLQDPTAICLLERVGPRSRIVDGAHVPRDPTVKDVYHLRELERAPLGTPYPVVAKELASRMVELRDNGQNAVDLAIDATGVGNAVSELVHEELKAVGIAMPPIDVVFTGGYQVSRDGFTFHVPKRDLLGTIDVVCQLKRLRIADELPEARGLIDEMLNIHREIDAKSGRDTYVAWRQAEHDDMAFAVTVAVWWAEHSGGPHLPDPFRQRRGM